MNNPSPWFGSAPGAAGPMRLFCFPFAGGNAAAFLPWQALLGSQLELQVAQLPGRGARLFEEPLRDLDELVERLTMAVAARTDKPFALFGHSLGALVAFEVARALRRHGLPGPDSLWVSGAEGPQTRLVRHRLYDLPDDEMLEALRGYNGTPAALLEDREMMQLLLPGLRADFAIDEHYTYRPEAPLDLPIHVLRGDSDPHVEATRAAGWARETSRPLHQYLYTGDHFFIHDHKAAIAALLTAALPSTATVADDPRSAP